MKRFRELQASRRGDFPPALRYITTMSDWRKNLLKIMEQQDWNPKALSLEAGKGETFLRDVLILEKDPSVKNLQTIAEALGVPLSDILGDEDYGYQRAPIVGAMSAGICSPMDEAVDIGLRVDGGAVAIRVDGDSTPPYLDGDVLMGGKLSEANATRFVGQECIVETQQGELYVRYVMPGAARNRYNLRSRNPANEDVVNAKIKWAAPITWIRRGQS